MKNTTKNTTKAAKNQIILDGVTIAWCDGRRMREDETGDLHMIGEFRVSFSASGASLNAIENAYICGQTIEKVADFGDLVCPHSDSMLRLVGLGSLGEVMLQIYRGNKKCDVASVSVLAHIDPTQYSNDEIAMKSMTWIREVARAIMAYRGALWSGSFRCLREAADKLHTNIYQIPKGAASGHPIP